MQSQALAQFICRVYVASNWICREENNCQRQKYEEIVTYVITIIISKYSIGQNLEHLNFIVTLYQAGKPILSKIHSYLIFFLYP